MKTIICDLKYSNIRDISVWINYRERRIVLLKPNEKYKKVHWHERRKSQIGAKHLIILKFCCSHHSLKGLL